MKFEKFSSRNIEETSDSDTLDEMRRQAEEINSFLEGISLPEGNSREVRLENAPQFDKAEAHRRVRARLEEMRKQREAKNIDPESAREARYGIDQEAARRKEKSEEIRARLLDLYNNNAAQNDAMLNQNPTQNKGWGDQEDSSSSKNDDEVQRKIEELKKNLGSAFRR